MEKLGTYQIVKGDNLYIVLQFEEPADGETPAVAFDLSVYDEIVCEFREGPADYTPLLLQTQLSTGEITLSGDDNDTLLITIPGSTTENFTEGTFHYDIRFIIDEYVETLLSGIIDVTSNISQI